MNLDFLRKRRGLLLGSFGLLTAAAVVLALMTLFSCEPDQIASDYGQRRGGGIQESVSGTVAFSKLFEQAGHTVGVCRRLSPRVRSYDTLVWIPNVNGAPSQEERDFLDSWLAGGTGRTLVYVGRDFDIASLYWSKMKANAPADQMTEIDARLTAARLAHDQALANGLHLTYARWFVVRPGPHYPVVGLRGPWAQGIDAAATDITVGTRLMPAGASDIPNVGAPLPTFVVAGAKATTPASPPAGKNQGPKPRRLSATPVPFGTVPVGNAALERLSIPNSDVLLETDRGDPLVRRVYDGPAPFETASPAPRRSQVIVVTNGAFLLNLGLVNREHRKLAARLVEACGPPGNVAFLESGPTGLAVLDKEPDNTMPSGLGLFTIYPLNVLLLHLIGVGLLFCFTAWPIFGRAKRLPTESVSDFGAHIEAVGDLLERTRDRKTARQILENYQKTTKETR